MMIKKFKKAFNKALTQFCTIVGAVTLTGFILYCYDLLDFWYSLAILAGVSALVATATLNGINRYQISKKIGWKLFYAITLSGIALLYLIVLEPTMPYRWLGFIIFILIVGIPADLSINAHLSKWDVLTDVAISCLAGYFVSSNWNNPLIVVPTLLVTYVIIVLWNFSINPKGINHNKNTANTTE